MPTGAPARPGCAGPRILQVHPSLACNLRCAHCYTDSGPWQKGSLPFDVLERAVRDAASMGYGVLAVSGGEPLLYPHLPALLQAARDAGMQATVTTNGTLLSAERLARLAPHVDLLAVSVDGPPALHDEIRASPTAFSRMEAGLAQVHDAGIPFGVIHTLTSRSWEHVPWLTRFAADAGARLLQLHPIEMAGRGVHLRGHALAQDDLCRAYLLALLQGEASVPIQFDAYHVAHLVEEPEVVYAAESPPSSSLPSDLLRLLVVEADGAVLPLTSSVSRRHALGNARERPLSDLVPAYLGSGYAAFRAASRALLRDVVREGLELTTWNERFAAASHEPPAAPA